MGKDLKGFRAAGNRIRRAQAWHQICSFFSGECDPSWNEALIIKKHEYVNRIGREMAYNTIRPTLLTDAGNE